METRMLSVYSIISILAGITHVGTVLELPYSAGRRGYVKRLLLLLLLEDLFH